MERLRISILTFCLGLSVAIAGAGAEVQKEPAAEPALESPLPAAMPKPLGDSDAIPIDWPTVLELARASNLEIRLAGEKVEEAHVQVDIAQLQWIPSIQLGTALLHHEGRTQLINGRIIDASKTSMDSAALLKMKIDPLKIAVDVLKAKQQVTATSGALDRATRQTLQEVSLAYVDLVAAQAGAAISIEINQLIGNLVERSEQMLKQGVGTQVNVFQTKATYQSQLQSLNQARKNQLAASARLVQLLNLQPGTRLYAAQEHLVPVKLIDEDTSEEELVKRALDYGPGLAEIVALLNALDEQERQLRRLRYFPTVEAGAGQGIFGGGIGSSFDDFNGRTDVGLNVYWDVTKMLGVGRTRDLFNSKRRQASLQHEQLNAKLATGVIVALQGARSARERIENAEQEIDLAIRGYKLSKARLDAGETYFFEVMQMIGALGNARKNYLESVIDYNRQQINLQFLVGWDVHSSHPETADASPPPAAIMSSQEVIEVLKDANNQLK